MDSVGGQIANMIKGNADKKGIFDHTLRKSKANIAFMHVCN